MKKVSLALITGAFLVFHPIPKTLAQTSTPHETKSSATNSFSSLNPRSDPQESDGLTVDMDNMIFSAYLSGDKETPPAKSSSTGQITLRVNNRQKALDYRLNVWNGKNIVSAHLHCGAAGGGGPVIAPLFSSSSVDSEGTLATGTITFGMLSNANCNPPIKDLGNLVDSMKSGDIYANIHTTANPDGEIRGQLAQGGFPPETQSMIRQLVLDMQQAFTRLMIFLRIYTDTRNRSL
jgi:hypothetical protein